MIIRNHHQFLTNFQHCEYWSDRVQVVHQFYHQYHHHVLLMVRIPRDYTVDHLQPDILCMCRWLPAKLKLWSENHRNEKRVSPMEEEKRREREKAKSHKTHQFIHCSQCKVPSNSWMVFELNSTCEDKKKTYIWTNKNLNAVRTNSTNRLR